ncbi:DegV family protein [Gorillibacterium timonense]|uniref:DegV family protein n=1 Tax=Gorillibacterium timonense TaxID=1689269 RepID=UPI00071C8AE5|nr:DegV family protein [Gorillibacterium timonense]
MSKVRVVTDSTADIPEDIRRRLDIEVVPLKVHFGIQSYVDSVTIHPKEFYDRFAESSLLWKSSQPSPVDFLAKYKSLTSEDPATSVISIHLSSALSGTYQSAVLAKSMMEEGRDITVIDSKTASFGTGIRVVRAAEAAQAGKSKEEILALLKELDEKFSLYFLVNTLQYLHKGGRIGKAAAILGSLLHIKPILSIDEDGEITSVDKVRGHRKAMDRILEFLHETWSPNEPIEVGISHGNALQEAETLSALINRHFNVKRTTFTWVGPAVGSHSGPGTIALFVIKA